MPPSSEELADIKSKQYVLITRAGLSISSSKMDSKTIFKKMLEQFDYHVVGGDLIVDEFFDGAKFPP